MLNVPSPEILEVTITSDGKKMLIKDGTGECLFRAASIGELRVIDCRHRTLTGEELKSPGLAFINWGEELCNRHAEGKGQKFVLKRECLECWRSLKSGLEGPKDKSRC